MEKQINGQICRVAQSGVYARVALMDGEDTRKLEERIKPDYQAYGERNMEKPPPIALCLKNTDKHKEKKKKMDMADEPLHSFKV